LERFEAAVEPLSAPAPNGSRSLARLSNRVECGIDVVHIARVKRQAIGGAKMDELNGRMMACQILITGLIARVANDSPDPLRFLTDFRDEIKAVVRGVNITGMDNTDRVRQVAQSTVDELFSLMKPPSAD
jgi:putative N-acetylmannosamine-6-phosphate epimerase